MGGFLTHMDGTDKSIELEEEGRRQLARQDGRQGGRHIQGGGHLECDFASKIIS